MRDRALCAVAVFLFCCSLFAADGGYAVIKKIPIPGTGSWDYLTVDAAARRLYVSHGTQVEVVDIDSLSPVIALTALGRALRGFGVKADIGAAVEAAIAAADAEELPSQHLRE